MNVRSNSLALGLVDGQAIGELERIGAIVTEFSFREPVLVPELAGKLHLDFQGRPLKFLPLYCPTTIPMSPLAT